MLEHITLNNRVRRLWSEVIWLWIEASYEHGNRIKVSVPSQDNILIIVLITMKSIIIKTINIHSSILSYMMKLDPYSMS
jgi:hypothetical protein